MELYIDNYKGFTDTIVSFKDVNFFVGDNSTGKTAVLNLLELISQPNFWVAPDFNSEEIELGYFSEMVNQNGINKKYFSIGSNNDESKASEGRCSFIWMKFTEKEFTPEVSECKFVFDKVSVWCHVNEKSVSYKTKEKKNETFQEWVRDFKGFGRSKRIDVGHAPFWGIIRSIVEEDLKGVDDHSHGHFTLSGTYEQMYWMAPVRAKARRWYESYKLSYTPEGAHTPLLLKRYQSTNSPRAKAFKESIIEFGKSSGLFDKVTVLNDKPENPFSVCVNYGNLCMNIANVGYGVSQVLPLVVELLRSKGNTFAIQQPEVHLHPRAQAAFGELLYKVATKNKNRLVIETHSDYMINRYRYSVNRGKSKISSQVLFFSRSENGIHVEEMPINSNGHFEGEVPQKYMSFFFEEELKMLEF